MRIVSGTYGGRQFHPPKGLPVRPTTDQGREAVYNVLNSRGFPEGARMLDLFAGTGGMGLEALSRGATSVDFVDRHPKCLGFISHTLNELGEEKGKTIRADVAKFLGKVEGQWDFIFMDPPYDMPGKASLVKQVLDRGLLAEGGICILEHSDRERVDHLPNFVESRRYGGATFSFFE